MTWLNRMAASAGLTEQEAAAVTSGALLRHPSATAVRHGYRGTDRPDAAGPGPVAGFDLGLALAARDGGAPQLRTSQLPLLPIEAGPLTAVHRVGERWHLASVGGRADDHATTGATAEALAYLAAHTDDVLLVPDTDTIDSLANAHTREDDLAKALTVWRLSSTIPGYRFARPLLPLLDALYQPPRPASDLSTWADLLGCATENPTDLLLGLHAVLNAHALPTEPPIHADRLNLVRAEGLYTPAAARTLLQRDPIASRRLVWAGEVVHGTIRPTSDPDRFVLTGARACAYPVGIHVHIDGVDASYRIRTIEPAADGTLDITLMRQSRTSPAPPLGKPVTMTAGALTFRAAFDRAAIRSIKPVPLRRGASATITMDWDTLIGVADAQDAPRTDVASAVALAAYHLASESRRVVVVGEPGAGKTDTVVRLAAHLRTMGLRRIGVCSTSKVAAITAANRAVAHGGGVALALSARASGQGRRAFVRRPDGLNRAVHLLALGGTSPGYVQDNGVLVATARTWLEVRAELLPDVLLIDDADQYTPEEVASLRRGVPSLVLTVSTDCRQHHPRKPTEQLITLAAAPPPRAAERVPVSGWWTVPAAVAALTEERDPSHGPVVVLCQSPGWAAVVRAALPAGTTVRVQDVERPFEEAPHTLLLVHPLLDPASTATVQEAEQIITRWSRYAAHVVLLEPAP